MTGKSSYDHKSTQGFTISPREAGEFIVRNWYWFLISLILCVGSVYIYLLTVTPQYSHSIVIMVKSDSKGMQINDLSDMIDAQNGYTGMGIQNEMYILRSHKFACEIVERLNLDIRYEDNSGLHKKTLFSESPINVKFTSPYRTPTELNISPIDLKEFRLNSFTVDNTETSVNKNYRYGDTISSSAGKFVVTVRPENLKRYADSEINVVRISQSEAALQCQNSLFTKTAENTSSLIEVTCTGDNLSRIDETLSTLIDVYNEAIVEDRNRIAVNTANFIDERIVIIGKELGEVEEELTELKQHSILVSSATQGEQSLSTSQSRTKEIETSLYLAKSIKDYLHNAAGSDDLIPNVTGVGDANVESQISQYNELLLQREKLIKESGTKNIVVQGIDKTLNDLRGSIDGSMTNYISNLNVLLGKARANERSAASNIQMIPKQEHMALSVARQQSIKESLYTYLLNKREENALKLAITEADVRVIETPFGSNNPISPNHRTYYILAIIAAIVIPLLGKIIYSAWNVSVRNKTDVTDATSLSVLCEIPAIPKLENEKQIWDATTDTNGEFKEAIKVLRSNIRFAAKDAKVIMLTSTLPNEGKSFICRNLAIALALAGKRVILIDTDMRKRTQTLLYNKRHASGLSEYLSEQIDNYADIILPDTVADGVDLIPAGQIPPNPSELLMSSRLNTLISELRKRYDYILVDNVPAMSLSDTVETNRLADITLYVVRCGVLDRRFLPEIESLHSSGKLKNMYIILNCSSTHSNKYGYNYGYGYGYVNK